MRFIFSEILVFVNKFAFFDYMRDDCVMSSKSGRVFTKMDEFIINFLAVHLPLPPPLPDSLVIEPVGYVVLSLLTYTLARSKKIYYLVDHILFTTCTWALITYYLAT